MTCALLRVPPEIIVHILAFLPIQALLKFSQTCQASHSLATSSLHTLSLGIHSTRIQGLISRLGSTHYPRPKKSVSAFALPLPPGRNADNYFSEDEDTLEDPYKVSVLIPDAHDFDYVTLQSFHTSLTKSILIRHGSTLRNLELSLWALTIPIAKALSGLSAVRALSIRIEDFPAVRAVPRSQARQQRLDERQAWDLLSKQALFAPRLDALRIENGEVNTQQLSSLLRRAQWCRELWLCKCPLIGKEVWQFFGSEWWEGRAALQTLGIMRCGGQLDQDTLDTIGTMSGLQFVSLQGCFGLESSTIEFQNQNVWHIPELIPPLPRIEPTNASAFIEVDPAYMD